MAEWSSPGAIAGVGQSNPANLATRVSHLLGGGGLNGVNLLNVFEITTNPLGAVSSNNDGPGSLTGDAGNDWYFYTNMSEIAAFDASKDKKTQLSGEII